MFASLRLVLIVVLLLGGMSGMEEKKSVSKEDQDAQIAVQDPHELDGQHDCHCDCKLSEEKPWVYMTEPILVGSNDFSTTEEMLFNFENAVDVSLKVQKVQLVLFWSNGYAYQTTPKVMVRTRVRDGVNDFIHWSFGFVMANQPTYSFFS